MKITKTIPGFTAEAALANAGVHFQAGMAAAMSGEAVRPAATLFNPNRPLYCLKFKCHPDPVTLECHWVTSVGTVNPATGRCE